MLINLEGSFCLKNEDGSISIWDRISGTYKEKTEFAELCGFPKNAENKLKEMLLFKDVYKSHKE